MLNSTCSHIEHYTQTAWTVLGLHCEKLWIMTEGAGKSWQGNCSSALKANREITLRPEYQSGLLVFLPFIEMQFSYGLCWFIRKAAAVLAIASSFPALNLLPPYGIDLISCTKAVENGRWMTMLVVVAPAGAFCWRTWCLYNAEKFSINCSSASELN